MGLKRKGPVVIGGRLGERDLWRRQIVASYLARLPNNVVFYGTSDYKRALNVFQSEFPHLLCQQSVGGIEIKFPRCRL